MWFLQNDESVPPPNARRSASGACRRTSSPTTSHVPYEMYVREARRIVGRHVFTEHDNSLAPGLGRTPVHPDSIAITDWYMDSHACTTDSRPGFHYDGKLILTEESRPGQIPYRALLPQGVDNLLVPVCLSATHVAWGAVRLEPVWMQTGEAAGFAAALAKAAQRRARGTGPRPARAHLVPRRLLGFVLQRRESDGARPAVLRHEGLLPRLRRAAGRALEASHREAVGGRLDASCAPASSIPTPWPAPSRRPKAVPRSRRTMPPRAAPRCKTCGKGTVAIDDSVVGAVDLGVREFKVHTAPTFQENAGLAARPISTER